MKRIILSLIAMLTLAGTARAWSWLNYPPDNQNVRLTSTNLPIVWIEVDGEIIVTSKEPLRIGDMVKVRITAADEYDLTAETI